MLSFLRKKLFEEVPIYSLVFTRVAFGGLMFYECFHYLFSPKNIIHNYFGIERFRFKFYGFSWVEPLPENLMFLLFYALLFLSFLIIIGAFYRIAIILFTIGFTYTFLLDRAFYLNHFYMAILYSALLCFMPANRYFSVDALLRPKIKSNFIHFWPVFLLRSQTEIILLYAGIVKLNYEWLVRFMPLKIWFAQGSSVSFIDYIFHLKYAPMLASYGTILLHLIGAPLLLWKPARIYVFLIYCCFHIINAITFNIGIFPYLTIAVTLIFFNPDWPMKLLKIGYSLKEKALNQLSNRKKNFILTLILLWILIQILLPLRCLLYPGNVLWNREGHSFSWRMKLENSSAKTDFLIIDQDSKEEWRVPDFYRRNPQTDCEPDMILQSAHHFRDIWVKEKGYKNISVYAFSLCSLNGRRPIIYINPTVDLAKEELGLHHYQWIMPFDQRLY